MAKKKEGVCSRHSYSKGNDHLSDGHAKKLGDIPSRVLFILVNGSRASLISRTTFVFFSMTGKIRVNLAMCPGYHDFGGGTRTPAIPGAQKTS